MLSKVLFQTQSTLILLLFFVGIYYRRVPSKHIKIMLAGIIWDILLILQIELTRGAIEKASKAMTNPLLLNFHVTIAVTTVILYFVLIYTGRKVSLGDRSKLKIHKPVGITCLTLRTLTYITSFMVAS